MMIGLGGWTCTSGLMCPRHALSYLSYTQGDWSRQCGAFHDGRIVIQKLSVLAASVPWMATADSNRNLIRLPSRPKNCTWFPNVADAHSIRFPNTTGDCCGCDPHRAPGLRSHRVLRPQVTPEASTDRLHACQSPCVLVVDQGPHKAVSLRS